MRSPWLSNVYQKSPSVMTIKKVIEDQDFYILLNPEIGSWVVLSCDEYARYDADEFTEIEWETLYIRGLALDKDGDTVSLDFPVPAELPSVVVVNITTFCNLRCLYCFASCEESHGENMTENVMSRIADEMLKMPSENITFELQGGEPLCYIDGMEKFITIAEEKNKKYGKTIKYRTVTNGTRIDDRFILLAKKYHINLGVSVDGPKELTNKVRVYPTGVGAFDDIMAGIKRAKSAGLNIDGSVCTLGRHNCEYTDEIVHFFVANSINFKPRPANILGREKESMTTTKPGQWAKAYKELYFKSKNVGVTNFSIHIFEENVYTPVRDYICLRYPCGAAREIISVNPDGTVYPCDGFKGENQFSMGNILNESIVDMLKKDWVIDLRSRTAKTIKTCSQCMYRAMCCSCCYSAYGAYGTIYREDPHCSDRRKIFDFLFEQWIREFVLKK